MRQLRWSTVLVALLAASVLTACSGDGDRPSIPPVAFGPGVPLAPAPAVPKGATAYQRQLPAVLEQNTAFIGTPDSVQIVAAGSGQTLDTVRPSNPPYLAGGPVGGAPVAATINGSRVVVWPFLVTVAAPDLIASAPTSTPPTSTPEASAPPTSTPPTSVPPTPGANPPLFGGTASALPPSAGEVAVSPSTDATASQPDDERDDGPPTGNVVELASIRADTHTSTTVLVRLPGWASAATSTLSVTAIGAEGGTVLLGVTDGLAHAALAVDSTSGQTLWTRDNFAVGALVGQTAVGVAPDSALGASVHVAGLDLADGHERWRQLRGYGLHVASAGPTLVAAIGQLATGPDRNTFQLLNGETGALSTKLTVPPAPTSSCRYDGTSVSVCYTPAEHPEDRAAAGFDATTGQQLWAMPDYNTSNKPAPLVTAVWHGLVYATTDGTQTVVFRANNRTPIRTTPGPAPGVVADQAGVAIDGASIVGRRPIA
ncbi:hypothetical protein [Pseudonocardia spinosispora]|uniref:hypothetical protein n=1 Tax=Pseudonocardia spinosispora TaxID=103441 RepID=UPI000405D7C3|nr:hypothetical protein [Pseudonocardia spinosispora]